MALRRPKPRVIITKTSSSTRTSRGGRGGRGNIIRTKASSISATIRKPAPPIRIAGSRVVKPKRIPLRKPITRVTQSTRTPRRLRQQAPPPQISSRPKPAPSSFISGIRDVINDPTGFKKIARSQEFKDFVASREGTVVTTNVIPNRRGGVDVFTPRDQRDDLFTNIIFGDTTAKAQQQNINIGTQISQAKGFRERPLAERAASNLGLVAGFATGSTFAKIGADVVSGEILGLRKKSNRKIQRGFTRPDPQVSDRRRVGSSALLSIDGFQGNQRFIGRFGTRLF